MKLALEAKLAAFEAAWMAHKAEKAADALSGVLDPAEVDEVRRFRGWGVAETYAALQAARAGEYEGTAEGGRALLYAPGMAQLLAEQEGITVGEAAVALAEDTDEASAAIADRAERYAREHGIDYATALVAVQRGER